MVTTIRTALAVLATAVTVAGCSPDPIESADEEVVARAQQVAAFCDAARANVEAALPVAELNIKGPPPHRADEITAAVTPLRQSNEAMLDSAPDEVRPDAELAFQLAEMQLDIYERTGGGPVAVTSDPAYLAKVEEADVARKRIPGSCAPRAGSTRAEPRRPPRGRYLRGSGANLTRSPKLAVQLHQPGEDP